MKQAVTNNLVSALRSLSSTGFCGSTEEVVRLTVTTEVCMQRVSCFHRAHSIFRLEFMCFPPGVQSTEICGDL